jgi:multidrug efflux pump
MLAATVIAVFWIPMFYYVIETLSERLGKRKAKAPSEHAPETAGQLPPEIAGPQLPPAGASAGHMPRSRSPGE